jgi:3D (Asp-Asp-Asp) domain-containing protein
MRVVYRSAFNFSIQVDGKRVASFGAPATVADAIAAQNIKLGKYDRTEPARDARVTSGMLVRVVRINSWTSHVLETIAAGVSHRFDPSLAAGVTRTVDAGAAGKRELTVRYTKCENERAKRIVLASSVVTEPRPKILVHGIGEFTAIFQGVRDAVAFTGTRIRMVATAYVPYCAGCSGITKLGLRAGHGVVAVDPNVIPLGSRLYVPGYGKAVAGDTGGAIRGNRIDLGFNDLGEALRFGRRPITVYVLR